LHLKQNLRESKKIVGIIKLSQTKVIKTVLNWKLEIGSKIQILLIESVRSIHQIGKIVIRVYFRYVYLISAYNSINDEISISRFTTTSI